MVDAAAQTAIDMEFAATRRPADLQRGEHVRIVLQRGQRDGAHIGAGWPALQRIEVAHHHIGYDAQLARMVEPAIGRNHIRTGRHHGRARIVFARTKNHAYLSHDAYCSRYPPIGRENADRLRIRTVVDGRTGRGAERWHRSPRQASGRFSNQRYPSTSPNSSPACPLIYFISIKAKRIACVVSAVIFVATSCVSPLTGFAFWETNLAYEGESIYNYLQVKNLSDRTILSTNVLFGVQSVTMKDKGLTGMYYDTALAAPALADNANSALILGMGTGTYARQLKQYYPKMNITGVEIDQKITDLAGEYFDEPADIPVTTYDGRAWLAASHDKYDVIMVDAYQDITIPFQMSSTEFFTMVREHLNPGGVMVVNMNMISDGQGSINEALSDTIASVFGNGNTLTADVPNTTNRELFAKKPGSGSEENSMQQASKALNLRETTYERTGSEDLEWYMEEVASRFRKVNEPDSASTILTDDKAPVEVLGMHAIDQIIADEAGPYRQILKDEGFGGLLRAVQ